MCNKTRNPCKDVVVKSSSQSIATGLYFAELIFEVYWPADMVWLLRKGDNLPLYDRNGAPAKAAELLPDRLLTFAKITKLVMMINKRTAYSHKIYSVLY